MNIIAVDDEKLALEGVMTAINKAKPDAKVQGFRHGMDAVKHVENNSCDVAFLDIEMREINGIELAKKLKVTNPAINIVFVTGYSEYTKEAFGLHASGYVMKPVTSDKIKHEIDDLRYPVQGNISNRVRFQTFGNFEAFIDEQPVKFQYSKTRELLAYLVDRNGALTTNNEISNILWEHEDSTINHNSYLKNIKKDLINTLNKYRCDNILIRQRGLIGIDTSLVACDYYDWLNGKIEGINAYRGEYMVQYSWSEFTHGEIEQKLIKVGD